MNERDHARLGFFLVVGCALLVLVVVHYVRQLGDRETLDYVTYFDQPVNGLKEGAAVRFRGVDVGTVDFIVVAPEHAWIEVGFQIDLQTTAGLGANIAYMRSEHAKRHEVNDQFRIRLESNLVTGLSYLQIDLPDANAPTPLDLTFAPPRKYVPSMPTKTTNMIETIGKTVEALPKLIESMDALVARVDQTVVDADIHGLRVHTGDLVQALQANLEQARLPQVVAELRQMVPQISALVDELRRLTGQLADQPESLLFGPRPVKENP